MQATTIGIDLAKNVFQVHGVDATGTVLITKKLRRSQVLPLFEKLPQCLVERQFAALDDYDTVSLLTAGKQPRRPFVPGEGALPLAPELQQVVDQRGPHPNGV